MNNSHYPVLLVEDDETDALMMRRAFSRAHLANPLVHVEHGEAAVDYLAGRGAYEDRVQFPLPALVLLDLKLPRLSGFEVLEWLKAREHLRRIPVVVLTSSTQTQDVQRAYDLGANSYLHKPVTFEGLLEAVRTVGLYWLVLNQTSEPQQGS